MRAAESAVERRYSRLCAVGRVRMGQPRGVLSRSSAEGAPEEGELQLVQHDTNEVGSHVIGATWKQQWPAPGV